MKAQLQKIQVHDGCEYVRGVPHGFKWRDQFEVTVTFDAEAEAKEFLDLIRDRAEGE